MKGFYKLEDGTLLHAAEKVIAPEYILEVENYTEYELPIDGWYYFESEDDARTFFGLPLTDEAPLQF